MRDAVRFEVLGPLTAHSGDRTLELGGQVQRKVLAVLLASPNTAVSDDRLVDEVWGGQPPPSAYHLIQVYVSKLRSALGANDGVAIERTGKGYELVVDPASVDAVRFADEVVEAHRLVSQDPAAATSMLVAALARWRGQPFADLADDVPSLRVEAVRLEGLHAEALEDRIEAGLAAGRHQEILPSIEDLTHRYPYRQRLWGQLMLALYRCGREAEALRTFQSLRSLLGEELGIEPSNELRELEGRILLQDPDLSPQPLPAPFHVPSFVSSFVGRSVEVGAIAKVLDAHRMVTLTGPGGIGKTRLAYEVAGRIRSRFADGVWSIDVSSVDTAEQFLPELARSLGVIGQAGTELADSVATALARKQALIVCDNCEHVVEEVAVRLGRLLLAAPRLRVLATSRLRLHVPGEVVSAVPAMALPDADVQMEPSDLLLADAVRLFDERAVAVEPAFAMSSANAAAVVRICRRLDGIPLAIEMAASRIPVLSPVQVADMVDERLGLLTSPDRGVPARQQTLKAAFDWSYHLLAPPERLVLKRLSVFAGHFDFDAAAAVSLGVTDPGSQTLAVLGNLVDASLLSTIYRAGSHVRYRLLDSVREFAAEHLEADGETNAVAVLHGSHFLDALEEAGASIATPEFRPSLDQIDDAYGDVRQALEWSLSEQEPSEATLRAAPALSEFWYRTAKATDAVQWSQRMLDGSEDAPPRLRAAAFDALAFGHTILGDLAPAQSAVLEAEQQYRLAGDRRGLINALFTKAQIAVAIGDGETMVASASEALQICDETGERWRRAQPLVMFAFAEFFGAGHLAEARALFEEALPIYRELGDVTSQVVMTLGPLSSLSLRQGDLEAAERYAVEAVAVGSNGWRASALACLGEVYVAKGDLEGANGLLRRAILVALDAGLENWFRIATRDLAQLAVARGEFDDAARLVGASLRNMPQWGKDPTVYEPVESAARKALGDEIYEHLSAEGAAMSHGQILELI